LVDALWVTSPPYTRDVTQRAPEALTSSRGGMKGRQRQGPAEGKKRWHGIKGATDIGKGSRSSKNHCAGGASDEEISCLSPAMKQRVGMKDQKKDIWDDMEFKRLVS